MALRGYILGRVCATNAANGGEIHMKGASPSISLSAAKSSRQATKIAPSMANYHILVTMYVAFLIFLNLQVKILQNMRFHPGLQNLRDFVCCFGSGGVFITELW
jgi:hypothetical protein